MTVSEDEIVGVNEVAEMLAAVLGKAVAARRMRAMGTARFISCSGRRGSYAFRVGNVYP